MNNNEQKLLPCPCCSGKPMEMLYDCNYWIQCEQCNLNTSVGGDLLEVSAIWNTRAGQNVAAGLPETIVPVLRAMVRNYRDGHRWDHLDAEAVTKAAEEIKQLHAINSQLTRERDAFTAWLSKAAQELPERLEPHRMSNPPYQYCLGWNAYADIAEPLVAQLRAEREAALKEVGRLNQFCEEAAQYYLKEKDTLRTANAELVEALQYAIAQVPELGTVPGIHAALSAYEGREGE